MPDHKKAAFVIIGGLTGIYCIAEIFYALRLSSLTLLTDGFHNVSDVVSLIIAWWADAASTRPASNSMSYGWVRAELLGALANACFLLSLTMYIVLEALPRLFSPEPLGDNSGMRFIILAAVGFGLNSLGTVVFGMLGLQHGHAHGHSHGDSGGHGHGHGHSHGHGHGDGGSINDASPDHGEDEHCDSVESDPLLHSDKLAVAAHRSSLRHAQSRRFQRYDETGAVVSPSPIGGASSSFSSMRSRSNDRFSPSLIADEHSSSSSPGLDNGHVDPTEKGRRPRTVRVIASQSATSMSSRCNANMLGVFIHYLGDAVSSLFVLIVGILLHTYPSKETWVAYVDPVGSLLIAFLILISTIPLLRRIMGVLMQSVPEHVDVTRLRSNIRAVHGVINLHDLHIWQLTDGMTICSVHIVHSDDVSHVKVVNDVQQILHESSIHSSAIQAEPLAVPTSEVFGPAEAAEFSACSQNCVDQCDEAFCCQSDLERVSSTVVLP
jgi:zinc transporter 1